MKTKKSIFKSILAILICITMCIPQGVVFASEIKPTVTPETVMPTTTPAPTVEPTATPTPTPGPTVTPTAAPAQIMPLGGGMMSPFALDDPIEVTGITAPTTYQTISINTGLLTIKVNFKVNVLGAAGGELKVKLSNLGNSGDKYFTEPDPNLMTVPSAVINQAGISVNSMGDDVEITFPFIGGSQNTTGDVTINFPFDHANWDGWLEDGKPIAKVTAKTTFNGGLETYPSTIEKEIKSSASTGKSFSNINLTPVNGEVTLDSSLIINMRALDADESANYWRYKPFTELKFILEIPKGAIADPASTAAVGSGLQPTRIPAGLGEDYDKLEWTIGTADADGKILTGGTNKWSGLSGDKPYITINALDIKFPSGTFAVDDEFTLCPYFEYTLVDNVPAKITIPTAQEKDIKIVASNIHMYEFPKQYGWVSCVGIDNLNIAFGQNGHNQISNGGTEPIPLACYTWINNATKPINLDSIATSNSGTSFYVLAEVDIYKYVSASPVYQGTRFAISNKISTVPSSASFLFINGSTAYNAINIDEGAGEYVGEARFFPLSNPVDTVTQAQLYKWTQGDFIGGVEPIKEMLVNAITSFEVKAKSWNNGKFPNGEMIKHNDVSEYRATLSWKGESREADFAAEWGAAYSVDGMGISTLQLPYDQAPSLSRVWYGTGPMPVVSYKNVTGTAGQIPPGSKIQLEIELENTGFYSVDIWNNPAIIVALPSALELSPTLAAIVGTSTTIPVYQRGTVGSVGSAVITEETIANGTTVYKIQTDLSPLPRVYNTATPYYIPLEYQVKIGAKTGVHNIASHAATVDSVYPATSGMMFGTSANPDDAQIIYNPYDDVRFFYDDSTMNFDGSVNTPYLRKVAPITSVASFTVASTSNLLVESEMFNITEAEWQHTSNPSAEATVELGATGRFKIELENAGNTYVGDLTLLNLLPQIGDKEVLGGAARGSEWNASLSAINVTILDEDKSPVANPTDWYTIRYCTIGDPTYNANGITRTGTGGSFTDNATLATAKSFEFKMNAANRLPGGYTVIIEGVLKAPDSATLADLGKEAFNSYAVAANYYANESGTTGRVAITAFEPDMQKFILKDAGNSEITKKGFVFLDRDADDEYNSSADTLYKSEGTATENIVHLYQQITNAQSQLEWLLVRSTSTDDNGQYEFDGLSAGKYRIKVDIPYTGTEYSFDDKGTLTDATHSHVDTSGYSEEFDLGAGDSIPAPTNAGIKAVGQVTVKYMAGGSMVAQKNLFIPATEDFTAGNTDLSGTIEPGVTTGFNIPTGYKIKPLTDLSKTYAITFASPTQVLEFEIVLEDYPITYHLDGGDNSTSPTNPTFYNYGVGVPASPGFAPATKTGHTFVEWATAYISGTPITSIADNVTGAKDLYAVFTPNLHEVSYAFSGTPPTGATLPSPNPVTNVAYGTTFNTATPTSVAGYTFSGWSTITSGVTVSGNPASFTMPDKGVELTGSWSANINTPYKVKHYQMNLSTGQYVLDDTDDKDGITDTVATYAPKTYTGFAFTSVEWSATGDDGSGPNPVIAGDGSLVIELYYDQIEKEVSYTYTGTQPPSVDPVPASQDYKFGETVTVENLPTIPAGYGFDGWKTTDVSVSGGTFAMIENDVVFVGEWLPNPSMTYKVEHHWQDLNGTTYTHDPNEDETGTGTTDTTADFSGRIKNESGFTYDNTKTTWTNGSTTDSTLPLVIAGDSSLVIKLYYTRQSYNITYAYEGALIPDGATAILPTGTTVKHGAEVTATPLSLAGYNFHGWTGANVTVNPTTHKFDMPTDDVALKGSWSVRDDTEYTVRHYLQDLNPTTYTEVSLHKETLAGTTDGPAAFTHKTTYDGFAYNSSKTTWETSAPGLPSTAALDIAPDGSLLIKLYYDRNQYLVSYNYTGAVPNDPPTLPLNESHKFGEEVTVADEPSLVGYNFVGWTPVTSGVTVVDNKYDQPASSVQFNGVWVPANGTAYKVEHYKQNATGTGYASTPDDFEDMTGTTDATATYNPRTNYAGFTLDASATRWQVGNSSESSTALGIASNGKLVIRLYYTRDKYNVSYTYTGQLPAGVPSVPATSQYLYEEEVALTIPSLTGYTFDGWVSNDAMITNDKFDMPAKHVALMGSWDPRTDTAYTVEHWQKDVGKTSYTKVDTENLTGTTDDVASFVDKTYPGFTFNSSKTTWQVKNTPVSNSALAIAPDGSLVIKLYYDRNIHSVTYNYTGTVPTGAPVKPATVTAEFGADVILVDAPTMTGYTFSGWATTAQVTIRMRSILSFFFGGEKFTMIDAPVIFTGEWIKKGEPITPTPTTKPGKVTPTPKPGEATPTPKPGGGTGGGTGNGTGNGTTTRTTVYRTTTNGTGSSNTSMGAKTGDNTNLVLILVALLLSVATMAYMTDLKRRRNANKHR